MRSHDPFLTLRGVGAAYGPIQALHSIDLEVGKGELVVVLGPNGAGKSTLTKAIVGLLRVTGEIELEGSRLDGRNAHELIRFGVALVPEGRGIFAPMTVDENLELGAYSRSRQAGRSAVERTRSRVFDLFPRLSERRRQVAGTLSGGEQQMLALGRALMGDPRLLLLDEPSLGLAPRVVGEILRALADLNSGGLSVLLVEQKAPLALEIAHRAYVLRSGRVAASLDPEDPASRERLKDLYLGAGL